MIDEDAGRSRLEHENRQLRLRVSELERQLKRVDDARPPGELGTALSERLALWQEAERITHVGTWLWNLVSQDIQWSDELYRILGYDPELDRPSSEAFFQAVHPDDRGRVEKAAAEGLATGVSEQVDFRVLRRDGSVRHVSMSSALLFDAAGTLVRAVGTIHDLTDEVEAAAELSARTQVLDEVARAAGVGWFDYDVRSGVLSGSLYRALGAPAPVALDLAHVVEQIVPADRERLLARWQSVLAGAEATPLELRVQRPGGRVGHLYVVPTIERDADGPTSVRGVAIDVSDRVGLEARLRQTEKMDLLGQVTAGVAHDFNNLLTVILCNLERIEHPKRDEAFDYIESAAQSAAQLTRRLLAFSRQAVVEPTDVDLTKAIDECLAIIGRTFGERIQVEHVRPEEPLHVRVDPSQLQQILLNLMVNARDAMSPDGGTLTLRCRRLRVDSETATAHGVAPGELVEVAVTDTGVGMDEAIQARIFEPFFTTKEPGKGTGLGLATVFGAVRQSDGYVEVSSRPGAGATFRVRLPPAHAAQIAPSRVAKEKGGLPQRILLVEDEPDVATSMARMLRRFGHEVTACTTPTSGIAAWRSAGGFELLITDYLLPEMTGIELTERLRVDRPGLPVLILSGWGFESERVAALHHAQSLPKPFTSDELLRAVTRATASG